MENKNPKLVLTYDEHCTDNKPYKIAKIFNSIKFVPGERLTKGEVNNQIGQGWSVEMQ